MPEKRRSDWDIAQDELEQTRQDGRRFIEQTRESLARRNAEARASQLAEYEARNSEREAQARKSVQEKLEKIDLDEAANLRNFEERKANSVAVFAQQLKDGVITQERFDSSVKMTEDASKMMIDAVIEAAKHRRDATRRLFA